MKKLLTLAMLLLLSLTVMTGCGEESAEKSAETDNDKKIVVGAKNFTEQFLLAKITTLYLKENGYQVEEKNNMGSEVLRKALANEQVDLYWEYTGTSLVNYNDQEPVANGDKAYEKVKELDKEQDIVWLNKSDINNTYSLIMRQDKAEKLGIKSIQDLADYMKDNELTIASNAEFATRPDGLRGVQKEYDFRFKPANIVKMDSGLVYEALKNEQVDVSVGFATDSRIKKFDLMILEDTKEFFPAYNAAITIRQGVLDNNPELKELLQPLAEKLDTEKMTNLNYQVDVEQKNATEVARKWLKDNDLLQK
ncbi:glycine betaine ABC transporter substrate-binding protein [Bacillus tianshenii]|nr:glycine betaine ABC transporter substrate-binding protein [Bacillus tianshenii]